MFDVNRIRKDFPILEEKIYGKPLVYLDNGATTQRPLRVVEKMTEYYLRYNSNVHRGVHYLSNKCTDANEQARETVREFINAESTDEVIFTRGTTESINLVAYTFGEAFIREGDEIIVTEMEHHANIVPWQMLCERKKAVLKVVPFNDKGELDMEVFRGLLNERVRLVCVAYVSNVLGTVNPVKEMIATAHAHGVPCLIDAAQSIPHMKVDVQDLDADFLVFSAHKIYGPTGVGVLYGKEEWLDRLPPYQGGGEMIQHVSFEKTTFNELPLKFEAGTPDYIGTTGLARALDYVNGIGLEQIAAHEHELTTYALQRLKEIPTMRIFGEAADRGAVISFLVGDIHHFDLGTLLDRLGIAVRTGHHCAQPLMQRLGIEGTVRASFAMYNTKSEIDILVAGIERVSKMF